MDQMVVEHILRKLQVVEQNQQVGLVVDIHLVEDNLHLEVDTLLVVDMFLENQLVVGHNTLDLDL